MNCIAPYWVTWLFEWLDKGMTTQEQVDKAMNWLLSKGIIFCNEVI